MEKTITLTTDLDAALLKALTTWAAKNEAETKMLEAQEAYFIARARIADIELQETGDQEVVALRKQNHKLRARQANRELQRELSTQGRRTEARPPAKLREGTKPVQQPAKPQAEKSNGLTHHMTIPPVAAEAKPAEEVRQ